MLTKAISLMAILALNPTAASSSTKVDTVVEWSDWDLKQVCHPSSFAVLGTEEEVIAAIKEVNSVDGGGGQVKVVGAGHSFSSIALTDDTNHNFSSVINLDNIAGVLAHTENGDGTADVTFGGGTRLRDCNQMLEDLGYAFPNLGATAAQSIAGAVATATHGTGRLLGSLATSVVGLRFVDGLGGVRSVSLDSKSEEDRELFNYARVGLGAFGVNTEVTVRVVPLFKMKKTVKTVPLDELLQDLPKYMQEYERFQWSYVPGAVPAVATMIIREVVPDDSVITGCWPEDDNISFEASKVAEIEKLKTKDGSVCTDVSFKTLVDSYDQYTNRTLYTEMEM
jgi:FAD/FMN-containing dehydrogenase